MTDHQALHWLMTISDPTGRLARWALYLQTYDFEIIHRRGRLHSNVDELSRPAMSCFAVTTVEEDSSKFLDPYEDEHLLHFLRTGKHLNASSKKQVKRVIQKAPHFCLEKQQMFYRWDTDGPFVLMVPKILERDEIIRRAHLLGHFR